MSAWKTQWEAYLSLSGLATQEDAKQVQALTLCFSRETVTIVENLGLSADQRGKVAEIIAASSSFAHHDSTTTAEAITTIQTRKISINYWVLYPPLIVLKERSRINRRFSGNPTLMLAAIRHFVRIEYS